MLCLLGPPVVRFPLFGYRYFVYNVIKWIYLIDFISFRVFIFHFTTWSLLPFPHIAKSPISQTKRSNLTRSLDNVLLPVFQVWSVTFEFYKSYHLKYNSRKMVIFLRELCFHFSYSLLYPPGLRRLSWDRRVFLFSRSREGIRGWCCSLELYSSFTHVYKKFIYIPTHIYTHTQTSIYTHDSKNFLQRIGKKRKKKKVVDLTSVGFQQKIWVYDRSSTLDVWTRKEVENRSNLRFFLFTSR